MGRVHKVDGFILTVFPNEEGHNRSHVTVIKSGKKGVFFLDTNPPTPGPSRLSRQDWRRAMQLVSKYYAASVAEWSRIHG